jgi:predicted PurR-regulated permease PerM
MNPAANARTISQLWLIAVAVLIVAALYLAKILLLPLGFAILFAFLLAPIVAFLERARIPRAVAVLFVILTFAGLLFIAAWALMTQLVAIANELPTYRGNIAQKMQRLHSPSDSAFSRAQRELENISKQLGIVNSTAALPSSGRSDEAPIGSSPDHPVQVREVARPTGRFDQLGGVLEPLATALLAVVFTFFVLLQREDLRNRLIRLSGDRNLSPLTQAMSEASRRISRYFRLQVAVNVTYGAIVCAALYFVGLPHAILFAALSGICRFIPYFGAPVAALTPTLFSLAVFRGWSHSSLIFGIFVVLEIVTANYLEPHIYGRHTGLSSLAVLIAATFWTLIWGPIGLILSVPLTVCLVVMGSHVPSLKFLTVLLGDQPVIPPYTRFFQRLLAHDEREAGDILLNSLKEESLVSVYDSILMPALTLVEMERQKGDLDESTQHFIRSSVAEMIDELGFRTLDENNSSVNADSPVPTTIAIIPVRDGSDDIVSTMLAQVLDRSGFHAVSVPILPIEETVSAVSAQKPEMVFLSGMPPVAMARAHRIFRSLREANPAQKISMGIWHYNEDPTSAARMISRTGDLHICTSLADAIAEARSQVHPNLAVPDPLDARPQLVSTPADTAA